MMVRGGFRRPCAVIIGVAVSLTGIHILISFYGIHYLHFVVLLYLSAESRHPYISLHIHVARSFASHTRVDAALSDYTTYARLNH